MLKVQLNSVSKEEARGVFWIVNDKLLAYPFYENATFGVAKSGVTYNHKALWKDLEIQTKYHIITIQEAELSFLTKASRLSMQIQTSMNTTLLKSRKSSVCGLNRQFVMTTATIINVIWMTDGSRINKDIIKKVK